MNMLSSEERQLNSLFARLLKKNAEKLLKNWAFKLFGENRNRPHVFRKCEGDFLFCLHVFS